MDLLMSIKCLPNRFHRKDWILCLWSKNAWKESTLFWMKHINNWKWSWILNLGRMFVMALSTLPRLWESLEDRIGSLNRHSKDWYLPMEEMTSMMVLLVNFFIVFWRKTEKLFQILNIVWFSRWLYEKSTRKKSRILKNFQTPWLQEVSFQKLVQNCSIFWWIWKETVDFTSNYWKTCIG